MQTLISAKALITVGTLLAAILSVLMWEKNHTIENENRVKVDHAAALDKYAAERARIEKQMGIADAVTNYRSR